ncbi:hypothetical protein HK100_008483, partial [Physocladia obscura]
MTSQDDQAAESGSGGDGAVERQANNVIQASEVAGKVAEVAKGNDVDLGLTKEKDKVTVKEGEEEKQEEAGDGDGEEESEEAEEGESDESEFDDDSSDDEDVYSDGDDSDDEDFGRPPAKTKARAKGRMAPGRPGRPPGRKPKAETPLRSSTRTAAKRRRTARDDSDDEDEEEEEEEEEDEEEEEEKQEEKPRPKRGRKPKAAKPNDSRDDNDDNDDPAANIDGVAPEQAKIILKANASQLKDMLKRNYQICSGNKSDLQERIFVCIRDGCFPKCPKCSTGRLRLSTKSTRGGALECPGYVDDDGSFRHCGFWEGKEGDADDFKIERPAWFFCEIESQQIMEKENKSQIHVCEISGHDTSGAGTEKMPFKTTLRAMQESKGSDNIRIVVRKDLVEGFKEISGAGKKKAKKLWETEEKKRIKAEEQKIKDAAEKAARAEEDAKKLEEAKSIILVNDCSLGVPTKIKIGQGAKHRGTRIVVNGWVHQLRVQGKDLIFLVLRDGTGHLQCTLKGRL